MENKKILIIPDLHLKWEKANQIIKHESADEIVFLGDYFDDFGDDYRDAAEMAEWLKSSLSQPNRTHLMGNHDIGYAIAGPYHKCSGYETDKDYAINQILNTEDWKKIKLHYWMDDYLCSHAGVHAYFYNTFGQGQPVKTWLQKELDVEIENAYAGKPPGPLLTAGISRGGRQRHGGILWCDKSEFVNINEVKQIFGHTPQSKPAWIGNSLCLDVGHASYYAIYKDKKLEPKWIGDL